MYQSACSKFYHLNYSIKENYINIYNFQSSFNTCLQREAVLVKELSKVRIPNRRYTFSTRIWLPKNYIVTKDEGRRQTVIPTKVIRTEPPPGKRPVVKQCLPVNLSISQLSRLNTASVYFSVGSVFKICKFYFLLCFFIFFKT